MLRVQVVEPLGHRHVFVRSPARRRSRVRLGCATRRDGLPARGSTSRLGPVLALDHGRAGRRACGRRLLAVPAAARAAAGLLLRRRRLGAVVLGARRPRRPASARRSLVIAPRRRRGFGFAGVRFRGGFLLAPSPSSKSGTWMRGARVRASRVFGHRRRRSTASASGSSPSAAAVAPAGFFLRLRPPREPRRVFFFAGVSPASASSASLGLVLGLVVRLLVGLARLYLADLELLPRPPRPRPRRPRRLRSSATISCSPSSWRGSARGSASRPRSRR